MGWGRILFLMLFSPLSGGLFEAASEPYALAVGAGLLFELFELVVVFGVWFDFDSYGVPGPDHFLVEHFVAAIDVGKQSAVAVFFFFIKFQAQSVTVAEVQGVGFGLGTVFLAPFGSVDADESDFLGSPFVFHEHGIAVDEIQKSGGFRHGNGGENEYGQQQAERKICVAI